MPCIRIKEMERKREEARSKKYACFDSSKCTSSVTNRCIPGGPAPSSPKLDRGNRVSVTLRNRSCQDNFSAQNFREGGVREIWDGNQLTVRLVRHSQRKRRATDRSNLRSMARHSSTLPGRRALEEPRLCVHSLSMRERRRIACT